ncbi:unnamed protein product [Macrosiphum euphorbiae]|uniref:HAT C-terminal dimerisation domain-containing protein n=1 Tax=Macrosiphum euphorbiae TaxID=13131 RepID=A0AAV0WDY4_9HEMI|nr:unnamed protein product [Macrosiphum euphorbiae]
MTDFVQQCKPLPVTKKTQFDEQLTKMIVKRFYTFALVEDPEFKTFLSMLNPLYVLPSRKTVSNNIIPRLYENCKNDVKCLTDHTLAVYLTTGGWTSNENTSFMATTAHFFDTNTELKSFCLDCTEFSDRHTADIISEKLKTIVRDWNIAHKVTAIVSDNASNVRNGIEKTNYRQVACFAHTLNLAVQNGLKVISPITQKVKSIVEYFKCSHHALAKLHATQEQMNLPKLKLIQDVVTRWNSTYDMLQRFVKVKDAINSTLAVLQANVELLTSEEWIIVEKASVVLEIFYEHQIISRLKPFEDNDLVTQAALLDPRYKKLAFSNVSEQKLTNALNNLKEKVCYVQVEDTNSHNYNPQQIDESSTSSSLLWKSFDEQFNRHRASHNPQAAGIIELDKYMNEPIINRYENPLTWWNSRKPQYPRLVPDLVLKRLCITATSVPCERLFSKTGMTLNDERNWIKPSKASKVLFLNQNR